MSTTDLADLQAAHAVAESTLDEARAKVAALTADLAARDAEIATLRAREEAVENWRCVGPDAPQSDCRSGGADLEEMCTPCAAHELHERWEREKSRADELAKRLEEVERERDELREGVKASRETEREQELHGVGVYRRMAGRWMERFDAAEATLSEYRKQLDNCEAALSAVRAELAAAESRVRELEGALRSIGCLFYGWRGGECATVAPRGERCARCAALSPRTVAADAQKETGR